MLKWTLEDGTQVINFNAAVYGPVAIKKAAHKFDDDFYVLIEQNGRTTEVRLIPKECDRTPGACAGEFCNEVLNQELRERVAAELAGIRSLLLLWWSHTPSKA